MFLKSSYKLLNFRKVLLNYKVFYCTERPIPFDYDAPYRAKPEDIPKGIWSEELNSPYTAVEEVKNRWHYVERLLPKYRIPEPPKQVSSVGWKSPAESVPNKPYFVARTRNHMLPVFQGRYYKDKVLVTEVCKVHGDIWQFEHDLKTYLEEMLGEKVESHVAEVSCKVNFRGDHIATVKEWLYNNGF